MIYFRCTQKLLRALDLPNLAPAEKMIETPLAVWYVNIIIFDNLIFLLFVNDPSLYSVLLHFYGMPNPTQVVRTFRETLAASLAAESISPGTIQLLLQGHEQAAFVKTASRSMLGSMNDLVDLFLNDLECDIAEHNPVDLLKIQSRLNRTPQRKIGWRYSVEAMLESVQTFQG